MSAPAPTEVFYDAYGAAWDIQESTVPEVMLSGPAGTGKSRAILEKLNYLCETHPGIRCLMLRKTRRSLTESGMVTFEQKVVLANQRIHFNTTKQQYVYPNGSVIAVGGMDKPGKIMSSEWDIIYVQEATELEEEDWEAATTRLRNGKMPFQQIIGDCNPASPTHWLRQRMDGGKTHEFISRHEDNPALFDQQTASWTKEGVRYLSILDSLSGVRYARLRLGHWVAAEGMVYQDAWDRRVNLIDRFYIPKEWPRYLAIDFGFSNPFVCQWWTEDPDGRLYLYREIYQSHKLVEDHAKDIIRLSRWEHKDGEPLPLALICDHDAEDRATLERHLLVMGRRLRTTAAMKGISDGIQNTASRMRPAGDGKPRLFVLRDSVVHRDPLLQEEKKPTCTAEEVEGYVWDEHKEKPVKEDDHGMDTMRYMVQHRDGKNRAVTMAQNPWED